MEVPQKPKTETALLSNNHTSGYISGRRKHYHEEISALPCLFQHCSQ